MRRVPNKMADARRPRILIVDDDVQLLDALQRMLRPRFEVTVATDSKEALRVVVAEEPFAVVIADLRMPGMDGVSLLFCIRQVAPDTVSVLLTGHADLEAATAAVNHGDAFRLLTKPCNPAVLFRALEASVERHRLITAGRMHLESTSKCPLGPKP